MVGKFYVTVVQAMLHFGSKKWVLTPQLEKSLEGLPHWVVQRMAVMGPKHQQDGTWVHTPIGSALKTVVLE